MVERFKYYDEKGVVYLHLSSGDPDLLNGVEPDRIRRSTKVSRAATKAHYELTMSNALRWSIIALPSPAWAKKVFPDLPESEAIDALWAKILKGARADGDDPIAEWAEHKRNLEKHVKYLNNAKFRTLHFKNSLGTDFTLGLAANNIWVGGGDTAQDKIDFFPNMPTEEIFTMPDRLKAEGRVVAAMPLSYQGSLIEGFEMTFKDGEVVSFDAKSNRDTLATIIERDEGSRRLGEVAIVPNNSPIAQMKTLFYQTLFDENASCHLALGKAYPNNMEGGDAMSADERKDAGMNDSLLHVDFMFGTADMRITGTDADGNETVFYDNGEFVF
jgi:aminopeptidase